VTVVAPARLAVVPVAASAAVEPFLAGSAEGVLLGAGEHAAWARVGGEVVVLLPTGAVRPPNGIEVPGTLPASLEPGTACRVVAGGLEVAGRRLEVRRRWDPRPRLPRVDPSALRTAAAALPVPPVDDGGFGKALAAHDGGSALAAVRRLLGYGPGLTPLGDDVLIGAMAGSRLLGQAGGDVGLTALALALAGPLEALAREGTTALSATLLRHAGRGEVDDASAALLMALCGRGDLGQAVTALLGVGHSSGRGLATGILAAASAVGVPA
jgi:hypothetical protein